MTTLTIPDSVEIHEYTVCGANVDQDPPDQWGAGSYMAKGTNADWAISFVENDVRGQATLDNQLITIGFALGAVHVGHAPRLGEIGLTYVDVSPTYIRWAIDNLEPSWYTLSGFCRRTFQTLHDRVYAHGPEHAYMMACVKLRNQGYDFMQTCIHDGDEAWLVGYPYADYMAKTAEYMALKREEWGVS